MPISKNLHAVTGPSGLGDRKCMAFSATTVSAGQGLGVVTATGTPAQLGGHGWQTHVCSCISCSTAGSCCLCWVAC